MSIRIYIGNLPQGFNPKEFDTLLKFLSMELAYKRLNNFDEAINTAKQWIEQNAPKCD